MKINFKIFQAKSIRKYLKHKEIENLKPCYLLLNFNNYIYTLDII